jgi:diguanylate cyclase
VIVEPAPRGLIDGQHITRVARAWARAIAGASYVPMAHVDIELRLAGFTTRLLRVLTSQPFDPSPAAQVGVELVEAHFASPETLGHTIGVLADRLPPLAGTSLDSSGRRVMRLLSALSVGYSRGLRERTLDEQESIRLATVLAQRQTESALRESQEAFRHAAVHDQLTGLPNRIFFEKQLADLITDGRRERIAICFIGITSLQAITDRFGHLLGDRALAVTADRLRTLARSLGHPPARFAGDQFVMLIEDPADTSYLAGIAEQIIATLATPVHTDRHLLPMSASVGVVERPVAGMDANDLLRAAAMTLQWAKADGSDRWRLFDEARSDREIARHALAADLALGIDRDEFFLEYQPLVRLEDRAVIGVEALVRWQHPRHGRLSPGRFIDLAEESGQIVRLGRRMLDKACRQAREWSRLTDSPPYVSVNVAVQQLRDGGSLLRTVENLLQEVGLASELLQLEITESASIPDDPQIRRTLDDIAGLGVRLALDDFGSGYSNLGYLQNLPVNQLKIDMQFVRDWKPSSTKSLLPSLVELAHNLRLSALAEGVETLEQADYLESIGCDHVQGYYFGRPQAPSEITSLLLEWSSEEDAG